MIEMTVYSPGTETLVGDLDHHKHLIREYAENLIKRHPGASLSNLANAIHLRLPTNVMSSCSTSNVSEWLERNHVWLELPDTMITQDWHRRTPLV